MTATDIISLSFRTIRGNRLRSGLTISIIALGITALIGIVTAIEAMNQKLSESFSTMGANGFTIRQKERSLFGGGRRKVQVRRSLQRQQKKSNMGEPITVAEAEMFKQAYTYPATISISTYAGNNFLITSSLARTTPTIALFGVDENYVELDGQFIEYGRNFLDGEINSGQPVCVLGYEVAQKLFAEAEASIGREVQINGSPFRVLAVLKSRGSTFGFSRDNILLMPYKTSLRNFRSNSFRIGVKTSTLNRVEQALGEAEGTMRSLRKLAVTEESNFGMERSNSLAESAMKSLRYLTVAVTLVGFITLVGAAIGLMNIMLVAVAERTKEVGLIKAIGGKRSAVHAQFLIEAVIISLLGAIIGIAVGIALGNIFGLLLQTTFVVPWRWIIYGIVICTIVGLTAGTYPALKAGRLNPIDALRYE